MGKWPIPGRVARAWREGGPAAVVQGAIARFAEARPVLLLSACPESAPGTTSGPLTFEWVDVESFDRDLATPEFQFPPSAARRAREWLARGDLCLLGRIQDSAATYLWVAAKVRDFPGVVCPIAPGTAYVYKTFTKPEFRGRGFNTAALLEARRRCALEGYRQVLIDVASNNKASRRAIERAGFVPVGRFLLFRIGRARRAWLPGSLRRRISGSAVQA